MAPSVLRINPNTIATSVPLASRSTTVVGFIAIAPTTTSEPASVAERAPNEGNAPVPLSVPSSSTRTNQPGKERESW